MLNLDLNDLECFRVAATLQHITRAAEQLDMGQPALSRVLARVEAKLGVPLFERSGRSVRLTRYGDVLFCHLERARAAIEDGRLAIADLDGPDRGTIALGFLRSLGANYIPRLVQSFSIRFPKIAFTFLQNNSAVLADELAKNKLDLIFTVGPLADRRFDWKRINDQNLVLIVPRSHRLARRRQVALREVAGEPFISFHRTHAIRRLTDELCAAAGFVPTVRFEGDDATSVPGFVAAGLGIALVPPDIRTFADVASLTISLPVARRQIGAAVNSIRYLSQAARAFRTFALANPVLLTTGNPNERSSRQKPKASRLAEMEQD
jgi:DNA-binding transcriptional LysR family regulator